MKKTRKHQSGQAIILIVFAIVGLIGMTALTVDGSNVYSDRRHAQNASDTAAFAAARAKIRQEDWKQAALSIATANGYTDSDHTKLSTVERANVEVYQCTDEDADCVINNLPPGDTLENYLQVKITSTVQTYFGGVIGIWEITNRVNSIVRVTDPVFKPIGDGAAMWSLSDKCNAITYGGSGSVTLLNAGIYANSKCSPAISNSSNSPGLNAPCFQAAGTINNSGGALKPTTPGCLLENQPVLAPPLLPNFSEDCLVDGKTIASSSNSVTIGPGRWYGAFPPGNKRETFMHSGVYCVDAGNQNFSLNANDKITGHNVTIYMIRGGVTWNGQAEIKLDAPDSGPYQGLLIYLGPGNNKAVSVSGGGDSKVVGTILAPESQCTINGGGSATGLQTQLTCWEINLGGGGTVVINYDAALQYHPPVQPSLELTK